MDYFDENGAMTSDEHSENTLNVEMINVDVDDADIRLRLAYKLLLNAATLNDVTDESQNTSRSAGKKTRGQ